LKSYSTILVHCTRAGAYELTWSWLMLILLLIEQCCIMVTRMEVPSSVIILFSALLLSVARFECHAHEFTFELPDNEKMCFYEILKKDVKSTLEFQVS